MAQSNDSSPLSEQDSMMSSASSSSSSSVSSSLESSVLGSNAGSVQIRSQPYCGASMPTKRSPSSFQMDAESFRRYVQESPLANDLNRYRLLQEEPRSSWRGERNVERRNFCFSAGEPEEISDLGQLPPLMPVASPEAEKSRKSYRKSIGDISSSIDALLQNDEESLESADPLVLEQMSELVDGLTKWVGELIHRLDEEEEDGGLTEGGSQLRLSVNKVDSLAGETHARQSGSHLTLPTIWKELERDESLVGLAENWRVRNQKPSTFINPVNFDAVREQAYRSKKLRKKKRKLVIRKAADFEEDGEKRLKNRRREGRRESSKKLRLGFDQSSSSSARGMAVFFGHESWNIMLNMMVGIKLAASRVRSVPDRPVQSFDFVTKETFSILPKAARATEAVLRPDYEAVRFVDYAPIAFRRLRAQDGLTEDEYLDSAGPEQLLGNMVLGNLSSLSELSSEGKSGALFYYTADGKFLVKTMTTLAAKFFRHILPLYFHHITRDNPSSLLTRFYGFHSIRTKSKLNRKKVNKVYLVVMRNIFHTTRPLHRRYDLKGSWVGRTAWPTTMPASALDASVALKDLDFTRIQERLILTTQMRDSLLSVLQKDTAFLESVEVFDYSLLLGVHVKNLPQGTRLSPGIAVHSAHDSLFSHHKFSQSVNPTFESLHEDASTYLEDEELSSLKSELPPWLSQDGVPSADGRAIYFCGLIDVLTKYSKRRKFENFVKSIANDSAGVSCVPPPIYARRFFAAISNSIQPHS